jgi:hypothetical protein
MEKTVVVFRHGTGEARAGVGRQLRPLARVEGAAS